MANNLEQYIGLIEECIESLGVPTASTRGKHPGTWMLTKKTAQVFIDVWYIQDYDRCYFQVMSPVIKIPVDGRKDFYHELMTLNDQLFGAAFTLHKEWIWLKTAREAEGLDYSEVMSSMNRVGDYAYKYIEQLHKKYEGDNAPKKGNRGAGDD